MGKVYRNIKFVEVFASAKNPQLLKTITEGLLGSFTDKPTCLRPVEQVQQLKYSQLVFDKHLTYNPAVAEMLYVTLLQMSGDTIPIKIKELKMLKEAFTLL